MFRIAYLICDDRYSFHTSFLKSDIKSYRKEEERQKMNEVGNKQKIRKTVRKIA